MESVLDYDYSSLIIGDVILVAQGGYGLVWEDKEKYVEIIGKGDYFGREGVRVKPYQCKLETLKDGSGEMGVGGVIGYESFGESPLVLLNTSDEEVPEWDDDIPTSSNLSALNKQVSGGHYKGCKIQPIEYIHANDLDYFQGNVVKYVTRHKLKNGKADIEKAIHYLELILELQYGE